MARGLLGAVRRGAAEGAAGGGSCPGVNVLAAPRARLGSSRVRTAALCAAATALLAAIIAVGIALGPAATQADFAAKGLPPSAAHPFGTDWLGRDMLARTLAGLSTSLLVGLGAAVASAVVAVVLAAVAALGGKRADDGVGLLVDLMMGIPHIVLLLLISFALGKGFWGVTVGIALTHWPSLTRVLRAEMLQVREAPYVAAARKLGASPVAIARRHLLPQLMVGLVLLFPHAILHEAAVTFLGFGLPPEAPAIGIVLSEAMGYLSAGLWWLAVFPGLALVAAVMLFDGVGTGLRRLVDPAHAQD